MASFYDRIGENRRNSYILMGAVFALVFATLYVFCWLFFGESEIGFFISLPIAIIYIAVTYYFSDSIVLAVAGAQEANKQEHTYLINTVENIAIAAGIPAPKVYVIPDPALNAFAVGKSPDKASVAFTSGLVEKLDRAQLEGVVAHEISHIKNLDSRMATIVAVMVGLIALLSDLGLRSMFLSRGGSGGRDRNGGIMVLVGLLLMVLAPIVTYAIRLMLSRQREYRADATAAQLTRYPEGLASALEKISKEGSVVQHASDATASLYIASPLSFSGFISTHPPIEDRIKRLREM
ncbi:MAG: M48 family metalloprotease [Candidatus Micrarchaeota archaeon]|nr:M48 family metalloprotease [Candidatus Micrarchaeota archaeon]